MSTDAPLEPGAPPEDSGAGAPQVTFYVIEGGAHGSRLQLACRLTEKAYRAGHEVLIWDTDAGELGVLDELLWSFGDDRTFIPHELLAADGPTEAPVRLSAGREPAGPIGVLINLAPQIPPCVGRATRVLEIIDSDPTRRESGRARFKAYRDQGLKPVSHQVKSP